MEEMLFPLAAVYLIGASLAVAIIDARRSIIPNILNIVYFLGGLAFHSAAKTLPAALPGAVLGFGSFLAFRVFYKKFRKQEGLGLGDVKFMAGAGLWVGWEGVAPLLLIASLSALVFVAVRGLFRGSLKWHERLPFGPSLAGATLAVWIAQNIGTALEGASL